MSLHRVFCRFVPTGAMLVASLVTCSFAKADPQVDRRSTAAIERILGQTSDVDFRNTPLDQAMRELGKRYGVVIDLDADALKQARIPPDAPITLKVSGIQLRSVLALALPPLWVDFVISDGRILITTEVVILESSPNRLYNINDLKNSRISQSDLQKAILNHTPDAWEEIDGDGGIIKLGHESLLIRQTQRGHYNVKQLLNQLRGALQHRSIEKLTTSERSIRRALLETTEIQLARASLRQACEHFARNHNIPILIDIAALEEEGLSRNEIVDGRLSGTSLKSALELILEPLGLEAIIQNDVIWVTSATVAEDTLETRFYNLNRIRREFDVRRVTDEFGDTTSDPLLDVIVNATTGPWEQIDGDGGFIEPIGSLVMCSQTQKNHEEIEKLIQRLSQIKGQTSSQPTIPQLERIYRALQARTQCSFADTPLFKVRDDFATRHGIPIRLDDRALSDAGIKITTPITAELSDVTLYSALQLVLRSAELTPIVHNDVLLITTEGAAQEIQMTRVYDLSKLSALASFQQSQLTETIVSMTSGPWEDIHGQGGTINSLPGCIVVRQSQRVHYEIEEVLRKLARQTVGSRHILTMPTNAERANAEVSRTLQKRVSVRLLRAPLNYALETLQRDYGMRYWLDVEALKDEGVSVTSRVTVNRSNTKLETILNQMLKPLKLQWVVRDEVVIVTTEFAADDIFEVQVYPVQQLTAFGRQRFLGELLERLQPLSTWEELDGDGGRMSIVGGNLFVRQRQHVFPSVAKALYQQ